MLLNGITCAQKSGGARAHRIDVVDTLMALNWHNDNDDGKKSVATTHVPVSDQ